MNPSQCGTVNDSTVSSTKHTSLTSDAGHKTKDDPSDGNFTSRYVIFNLRFMMRFIAFFGTATIIVLQIIELFTPAHDQFQGFIETFSFGGLECKVYRHHIRHNNNLFHVYVKCFSLTMALWLQMKICVLFLPLSHGYWLYTRQEKLIPLRTTAVMIAFFNSVPLIILTVEDCLPAASLFLFLSVVVFICLLMDRIFVRDRDYYKLDIYDDMPLLSSQFWEGQRRRRRRDVNAATYSTNSLMAEASEPQPPPQAFSTNAPPFEPPTQTSSNEPFKFSGSMTTSKENVQTEVVAIGGHQGRRVQSTDKLCTKGSRDSSSCEAIGKPSAERTKDILDATTSAEPVGEPTKATVSASKEAVENVTTPVPSAHARSSKMSKTPVVSRPSNKQSRNPQTPKTIHIMSKKQKDTSKPSEKVEKTQEMSTKSSH
uniref:Transmembrane protein n=1 Tax=Panagrellus redivivus TaxID=6233 RepID=A0A7E4WCY7_PANRE